MSNNNKTRPGFNGQGKIDLNDYNGLHPRQFKDCKFSRFEFFKLNTLTQDDIDKLEEDNLAIRKDTKFESRVDEYRVSFEQKGFLTTDGGWPPSMDQNGKWLDGRGRVAAAWQNEETWIPVAIYIRSDDSEKNKVTNGLRANKKLTPFNASEYDDYVNGGVYLINMGELKRDKAAITDWLYNEVEIDDVYNNQINGVITRMVNSIFKKSKTNNCLMRDKSPAKWKKWVEQNVEKGTTLVNTGQEAYPERLLCRHIIKGAREGENLFANPLKVVLYSSAEDPKQAEKDLKTCISNIDELYEGIFALINSMFSELEIKSPEQKPYKIIGAIPQIVNRHDPLFEGGNLVDVGSY
jgi:hypothetical protein